MSKKASLKELNELHKEFTQYLLNLLKSGEKLSSGELGAIASFLKNNNITADMLDEHHPINNLVTEFMKEIKEGA